MANSTGAYGLRPVGSTAGGPYSGETIRAYVSATGGTAIYTGDIVKMNGSGSTDGYPEVTISGVTDSPWAVVTGVEAIKTNLEANNYRPASTAAYLRVVPVTGNFFQARMNGTSTSNEALVGSTTIFTATAGSTVTGYSGYVVSATDAGTSIIDNLRIMQIVDSTDSDPSLAAPEVIVMFNDSQTQAGIGTGSAGV